jgi:hypothetical protein
MRLSQWDYLVFRKELLFHPFPQNILVRREPIVFNPKVEGHKVHKENTEWYGQGKRNPAKYLLRTSKVSCIAAVHYSEGERLKDYLEHYFQ